MIRVICVYAPQSRKPDIQKDKFYDELVHEWDMKGTKELTLGIGDFNGYAAKKVDGFEGVHGCTRNWGAKFARLNAVGILRSERFMCGKYMV